MKIKINKKRLAKILVVCICWILLLAVLSFEFLMAAQHEIEWQTSDANAIYDDIMLNLDMAQVAVQVGDDVMFSSNLDSAKNRIRDIDKLYLITKHHHNYVQMLRDYIDVLDSKRDFVSDIKIFREGITNIDSTLKSSYGDKTTLTRNALTSAPAAITSLQLDSAQYSTEFIKNAAATTNTMLSDISTKASELAKCIDACYADNFTTINNSLGEVLTKYSNDISEVNKTIDAEFDFSQIAKLKSERPQSL